MRLGIARYLKQKDVQYWLGPDVADSDFRPGWYAIRRNGTELRVEAFSPLYKKSAGTFSVRDGDRIVRLPEVVRHPDMPPLALWRIR
jgi:hypothetical protein